MGIILKKAGWQTMVMDQGRRFNRHLGIPLSGVTDLFRYWWANGLVGNYDFSGSGPVVLELRSGSVEIDFKDDHTFAMTGSKGEFFLDDTMIVPYRAYHATKKQTLHIKNIQRNGTVYLAISGTWNVNQTYGSASADILSPFPGTAGKMVENGEKIKIKSTSSLSLLGINTPDYIRHSLLRFEPILRITAGPELTLCGDVKHSLVDNTFVIDRKSNRMGYRLNTTHSSYHDLPSMISSIVLPGMIQWPSGNQPILLLPNCQTTGGYPRVGKVIDADLWKLAYVAPGDHLHFIWSTREEALYLKTYEMGQFTQAWEKTFPRSIKNHRLSY